MFAIEMSYITDLLCNSCEVGIENDQLTNTHETNCESTVNEEEFSVNECEKYVESIVGIVSPSDFEIHVGYLISIHDVTFSSYKHEMKTGKKLETIIEKQVLNSFLKYTQFKRTCKNTFYKDVSKLRYSFEIREDSDKKEAYNKLFRLTRMKLWKVVPYEFYQNKPSPIDVFYEHVKNINDNITLETALRKICVLEYEDDVDLLLKKLKNLLVLYHPDKNKHDNTREVYGQVEKVYGVVNTLLKKYESCYEDTIFCNMREFLGWKLNEINDQKLNSHMISMERPLSKICRNELHKYRAERNEISNIEDKILNFYRDIIKKKQNLLEIALRFPKVQNIIRVEDKLAVSVAEEEKIIMELKNNYKSQIANIKEIKAEMRGKIKELLEFIKDLEAKLNQLVKQIIVIQNEFVKEIEYERHNLNSTKRSFTQYAKHKRIENLKRKLRDLNLEEKQTKDFLLFKLDKIRSFLQKEAKMQHVGFLNKVRKMFCSALGELCTDDESLCNYMFYYNCLFAEYKNLKKEMKNCIVEISNQHRLNFYKKERVPVGPIMTDESGFVTTQFKDKYTKCNLSSQLEKLNIKRLALEDKYKTSQEIELEQKKLILDTKEFKKIIENDKKEIEKLRHEWEIAEIKAEEERKAKEEEKKAKEKIQKEKEAAELKIEIAEAEAGAYCMLCESAEQHNISVKKLNSDLKKCLWKLFTLSVLNENSAATFREVCEECKNLKFQLESGYQLGPDFYNKLVLINSKFRKLQKILDERKHDEEKYSNCNLLSDDRDICSFLSFVICVMIKSRSKAELEKIKLQFEIKELEDLIQNILMQR